MTDSERGAEAPRTPEERALGILAGERWCWVCGQSVATVSTQRYSGSWACRHCAERAPMRLLLDALRRGGPPECDNTPPETPPLA